MARRRNRQRITRDSRKRVAYCRPPGYSTMDRFRSLAQQVLAAAWSLVTGVVLVMRRRRPPTSSEILDNEQLARARRAADDGRLKEAWALYRQLPSSVTTVPRDLRPRLRARRAWVARRSSGSLSSHRADRRGVSRRRATTRARRPRATRKTMSGARMPPSIGRYQLLEPIGRGAMGNVYLGRDPMINRILALKAIDLGDRLRPRWTRDADRELPTRGDDRRQLEPPQHRDDFRRRRNRRSRLYRDGVRARPSPERVRCGRIGCCRSTPCSI